MRVVNRAYTGVPSYLRVRIASSAAAALGSGEHSLRFPHGQALYDPDTGEEYLAERWVSSDCLNWPRCFAALQCAQEEIAL